MSHLLGMLFFDSTSIIGRKWLKILMDYGNPPIISVKSSGRIPIFGYRNMFAEVEENDVL